MLAHQSLIFQRLLSPLADCIDAATAERMSHFRIDSATQSRIDLLADKASDDTLTDEEQREYAGYIEAIDIIGIFQAKARKTLARKPNQ